MAVQTLDEFMAEVGRLSPAERTTLVNQARVLIEQIYVHLPLKRAMHAVDPVQRLRNLAARMGPMSEREFHDELIGIFTELRDLHTNYILPAPYAGRIAFLPFLVEEGFTDGGPRYLVTKLFAGFSHPSFGVGAELTHWSGVPIDRAVEVNAARQAGSNADARHARGLEAMTLRDMSQCAPPDDRWVDLVYVPAAGGEPKELRVSWRVFVPAPAPDGVDPGDAASAAARLLGYDASTEARRRAKKELFNPAAMQAEAVAAAAAAGEAAPAADPATTSTMPDTFAFRTVHTPSGEFGYLRIWTFMVRDADAFLAELVRILGLLPPDGLIVDVRGNGGGNLLCAEGALQLFTPHRIQPTLLSFLATPLTLALCTGPGAKAADLTPWHDPIGLAAEIGAPYSQGLPVLPEEEFNGLGQRYQGPALLITDALCYSATDMFAAGFRDNELGPILGTAGNTGAGGANVWTHELFRELFPGSELPFRELAEGATFRVAFRRTTRQGKAAGTPVEDLGIVPDAVHRMTARDALEGNQDLLAAAGRMLAEQPVRRLTGTLGAPTAAGLPVTLATRGIDRVDLCVDGRPVLSVDVADGGSEVTLPRPAAGAETIELAGFVGGKLVVRSRLPLR
jgi:Peptidase family S41